MKIVSLYRGTANLPYEENIEILNSNSDSVFTMASWKKLNSIIREFNPDLVQANSGDTLKFAVFSKKLFGWRSPLVFRNASEVGRYLKSSLQKKLNEFLYKQVAAVISVSQVSKQDILSNFKFLDGKTEVIGVGLEDLKVRPRKLFPENKKHIVHVGGFTFEKNHKQLLDIFKKVLTKNNLAHLHLIGDGPLKQEIELLVNQTGLNESITFYGFVNDPLSYISAADVLVLPSLIEGLPGVILEAMICKTPVVAYNVGGISEIVSDKTGYLISSGDLSSFSKAVLQNLEEHDILKTDAAYSLVTSNFKNAHLALKFVKAYENLLAKKE